MNTQWTLHYWTNDNGKSAINDWLNKLPLEQYEQIAEKFILLEKCGNQLKMPHSKALKEGLFELREPSFGLRIYYCFSKNRIIIILCAGDKKSQEKDIKLARSIINKIRKEFGK